ncbi:lamin tail domain-containing protein [Akkermansiaceae bacterium]|nr:lamin tail domain-containing protein [Akkermansiaceae bacterium]
MHTQSTKWWNALLLAGGILASPMLSAKVWILEFVAANDGSVVDENGDPEDWIEIYNDSDVATDLSGWSLTDDATDLQKWVFPPGTTLGAKKFLTVFASGKNRRVVGDEFHTNFKLDSGGEYLGLIKVDGSSVEHEYAPAYPAQVEGASYGVGQGSGFSTVIEQDTPGQAGVPADEADFNANYVNWNNAPGSTFTGPTWRDVNMALGFDSGGFLGWISDTGDFRAELHGITPSLFTRIPFEVADPNSVNEITLRMRWDDGFIAYINGVKIASDRDPASPGWDAMATSGRADAQNDDWEVFSVDLNALSLVAGTNVLAIHGMNESVGSSDVLIYPELDISVTGGVIDVSGYMSEPSFGVVNNEISDAIAPIITDVTDLPERPVGGAGSAPILVTARVSGGTGALASVRMYRRIMFGSEVMTEMNDDGTGGDAVAGDGVYSALLSTTSLAPGEMIRWRVEAKDNDNVTRTSPAYLDPQDGDQYYGTVAFDPALNSSQLPIVESFVQNQSAVDTRSGSRVSLYYLGQFYDNVQMDLHGQSTSGFPKKSYDLDFNKGNRFLWREGERRVKDVNLLTNYADKSKVLNTLAYDSLNRTGAQAHYAFAVRVQRNGAFFSVADLVEDGDERYLDRVGLDEEGTLYKMYDRLASVGGGSKKTPKDADKSDLQALINGVTNGSTTDKRRWAYDNIDIAASVNYLSAYTTIGITDAGHKNYYMYRDTHGTGEWRPLPWDVDLSFGRKWTSTLKYFDPALVTNFTIPTTINPFWAVMQTTPEFRDMMVRRVDAIRDELMLSNADAAVNDWIEDSIVDIRNQIGTDADLDDGKWPLWGSAAREANAMQIHSDRIINDFLPARRNFLFSTSFTVNGAQIAPTEPTTPNIDIQSVDFLPVSGNQDEEYIILKNNEGSADIDLSGWTLSGGVDFTFPVGTVILSGAGTAGSGYQGLLHVVRDAASFRARATGPKGGEFRYVQGGYSGQLSARGETIELRNDAGVLIDSFTYAGTPTVNQLALRVTEVNYHPAAPSGAESAALPGVVDSDFEFVELKNISGSSIDLGGAAFTEGIEFTFEAPLSLSAGDRLILAKNPSAFAIRYPAVSAPVVGPFTGQLDNDGETLRLVDGVGENILVFTYNDRWYPPSDGGGLSLVIRDDETDYNALSDPAMWAASESAGGSPGTGDTSWLVHFNAWQEGVFPSTEWLTDGAFDADPDGDGRPNWEEYAYATNPLVADSAQVGGAQVNDEGIDYLAVEVRRVSNGSDLIWSLQKSSTLVSWPLESSVLVTNISNGDGSETAVIRESSAIGTEERKFLRLHLELLTE